jgi:hypothetical protein
MPDCLTPSHLSNSSHESSSRNKRWSGLTPKSESTNKTVQKTTLLQDRPRKARDSIRFNREFDSIEIDESNLHDEKHDEQWLSTLSGIKLDWSDEFENADEPIRVTREFDSNQNDSQREKYDKSIISTLRGITMDRSDEYENENDSIRFSREFDSNESDESDWQNGKHDEWKRSHCVESEAIEVMNIKMQMIQFASIVH